MNEEKDLKTKGPVVLVVMDGVGVAPAGEGNAVILAKTPNLDQLWPQYPHGYIEASGVHVGLPVNVDGNSEVGHMTLGAGRILLQDLPRINSAIEDESFYENPAIKAAFAHARKNKSAVHLMGLVGTGFVHSSMDHLEALIKMAVKEKVDPDKVFIHCFSDGRDSAINISYKLIDKLEDFCAKQRCGRVASVIGRAYAMDRDDRWKRTRKAYDLLVNGKGRKVVDKKKHFKKMYDLKQFDEYMLPALFVNDKKEEPHTIQDGDSVIFFNYRPDRALQITQAFEDDDFEGWERKRLDNLYFVGMTDYKKGFPENRAFPPEEVLDSLGSTLSEHNLLQLRVAESEKFPHVTYFFNGGNAEPNEGETWIEVPSPKDVLTYDLKPEMSMAWVTDTLFEKLDEQDFDFILVNFAGPDMVGHTGNIEAAIKAMEVCDACVGRLVEKIQEKNGTVIVTADHGNAEEMLNLQNNQPDTKHSTNQVPVIIVDGRLDNRELEVGSLIDIAPTVLKFLGIEKPPEMTGKSLV